MTAARPRPLPALDRRWAWIAVIAAIGLALRIAGAQGALWLDEAWSAKLAHEAATPLGVFLHINHDNNHHLNSLWLQLVGFDAPPLLARALSIATGTAAIVVAGAIPGRARPLASVIAAWLFAVSPILVTLGSEARGYAPMSLALLASVLLVDRELAGSRYRPEWALAGCFLLGPLAQLTMVFGICAVVGWYAIAMWRRGGFRAAAVATLRLFAIPMLALALALALVFVPAMLSSTGFQFGRYDPFGLLLFLHGVDEMVGYTIGVPVVSVWSIAAAAVLAVLAPSIGAARPDLYRLAILGFPLTLALLHAGNVAHPRYYLVAGIALLLLVADAVAAGLARRGWQRVLAVAVLAIFSGASLAQDVDLVRNQRGDAGAAIRAMRARAPDGTSVIIDRDTALATVEQSAAFHHYPVHIRMTACPPARFVLLDRFRGETFPALVSHCGVRYAPVDRRFARGLSGSHWTLYERRR